MISQAGWWYSKGAATATEDIVSNKKYKKEKKYFLFIFNYVFIYFIIKGCTSKIISNRMGTGSTFTSRYWSSKSFLSSC